MTAPSKPEPTAPETTDEAMTAATTDAKPSPSSSAPSLTPLRGSANSFTTRLGLALVEPRWAMAVAGDRHNPGRSGSDLMRVIGLVLLGGHLRGLMVALWLMVSVQAGLGLRTGGAVLSAALTTPLAFLVIAAGVLWLLSGKARHLGRAFDLASVAAVPLMLVLLAGVAATQLFELEHSRVLGTAILGLGFGWAGALVALAIAAARMRITVGAVPPADVALRGRRAGIATLVFAAAVTLAQLGWIAAHVDELRPVSSSVPVPSFALPEVQESGGFGERYAVTPGQKPILLDFWATWCSVCVRGLPALEALRKAHPEVEIISINLDDAASARRMFAAKGYGLRLLFDDGVIARRFGVSSLPHLVIIDSDGKISDVKVGHPGNLEALLPAPHIVH